MGQPSCPDCHSPMGKAGKVWSGTHKVQRYRCGKCGKTTIVQSGDSAPGNDSKEADDVEPPKKRLVIIVGKTQYLQLELRAARKNMTLPEYTEWYLFNSH